MTPDHSQDVPTNLPATPDTIPDELPANLPQQIDVDQLCTGIAEIPRQAQMIVMLLSCGWTQTQIAEAHNVTIGAISKYIAEHGLYKLVSLVNPQARQKFEAARWSQLQHACLTHASAHIDDMSPSQAVVAAAIAVDKRLAIDPPAITQGQDADSLEIQLTARFRRA